MKSILISIQPKWCELIALGKKTVEVRKTKPKLETPFKCYIYATKGEKLWKIRKRPILVVPTYDNRQYVAENEYYSVDEVQGKVIGEFVCNNIDYHGLSDLIVKEDAECTLYGTCLTKEYVLNYFGYQKGTSIYDCKNYDFYGWHITDLVIYDKPKELSEFERECKGGCDIPYMYYPPCENCRKNRLTRPPQSWCYVENDGGGK